MTVAAAACLALAGCTAKTQITFTPRSGTVLIDIDVAAHHHPISPLIYGVAFASRDRLTDLGATSNRSGGNAQTRYNWRLNASNHASDWFFESAPEGSSTPGASTDSFVGETIDSGAQPILTVPTMGWIARLSPGGEKLASFSVAKYGLQQQTDPKMPDAGNGLRKDGVRITGNDPGDANTPSSPNFERAWIEHLVQRWKAASNGGIRYYIMDNEPGLWQDTHRDVHPTGPTMQEVRDRILAYAAMVKSVDPTALVAGPEEWSYLGMMQSGYDLQYNGAHVLGKNPDRRRNHGWDYYPWLLDQMHRYDGHMNKRLLDILTVHYYPQGGEFMSGDDVSEAMQLRRNRSTRSLWDPDYVDETWVNDKIQLIPRLRKWTARYYPGTEIGITEYNWGAEKYMNGATTLADVLGIFGREGLDMANYWTTPDPQTPTFKAMQMYRNYDGAHSNFGDMSVSDVAPNPDTLSSFAAVRSSDQAITVMVINKALHDAASVRIQLSNAHPRGDVQVWQLTSSNQIEHVANRSIKGDAFSDDLPAQSITLLVIPQTRKQGIAPR